jgi:serine/threonine protein kinase
MSPEICNSEPYSTKSDVWSAGCVLCEFQDAVAASSYVILGFVPADELCTLKHAFAGANIMGLLMQVGDVECPLN